MRYYLNSAAITATGRYDYRLLTPDEARAWVAAGGEPVSTVGYATTADLLGSLVGRPVAVNRVPITMLPGDEALVLRFALDFRLSPGAKSGQEGRREAEELFRAGKFELGLLTRVS